MIKGKDSFEQSLRNILDPYEVPYNSADWHQLEKHLDEGKGAGRWGSATGLIALLLGGTLAVATTVHLMVNEPDLADGSSSAQTTMVSGSLDGPEGTMVPIGPLGIDEPEMARTEGSITTDPESLKAHVVSGTGTVDGAVTSNVPAPVEPAVTSSVVTTPKPGEASITASITEGCPGTTVDFAMNNVPEDGIYLWNFGDGSFSNKPKPSHTFSKAGTFEVMLSHSSMSGGKFANKPVADRIVIHEVPDASFQFIKREYENSIPSVHFENRSVGGKSYHWDFGDGSSSTVPHPDHVYKEKGNYTVVLTTSNANGCVDRAERNVRIESDYNLLASSTFSPNGDGLEDTFIPEALRTLKVRFHMSIFDARTGELVFETTDAQRPWNGRISNRGEHCVPGEYLWMVEMKDGESLGGTYNGSLSLVR